MALVHTHTQTEKTIQINMHNKHGCLLVTNFHIKAHHSSRLQLFLYTICVFFFLYNAFPSFNKSNLILFSSLSAVSLPIFIHQLTHCRVLSCLSVCCNLHPVYCRTSFHLLISLLKDSSRYFSCHV